MQNYDHFPHQWLQNQSYRFRFRGDGMRTRRDDRESYRRRQYEEPGTVKDSRPMPPFSVAPPDPRPSRTLPLLVRGPDPSPKNQVPLGKLAGERNRGGVASSKKQRRTTDLILALRTTQRVREPSASSLSSTDYLSILAVFTGGKPLPSDDVLNALFSRLMVRYLNTCIARYRDYKWML